MSQAERKPNKYKRGENVYSVDDAVHFARDILWKAIKPFTEGESVAVSWDGPGCTYHLWASGWDTAKPEYMFAYDDRDLNILKTYAFSTEKGKLIIGRPDMGDRNVNRYGDTEYDLPELISHLATNDQGVNEPETNKSGSRVFETIAAHYALTELLESPIAANISSVALLSDPERRNQLKLDCAEATIEQGIEIDGELYVYTRSKGTARLVLEDYFKQQRKTSIINTQTPA